MHQEDKQRRTKLEENAFLNFGTKLLFLPNSINASKEIREEEETWLDRIRWNKRRAQLPWTCLCTINKASATVFDLSQCKITWLWLGQCLYLEYDYGVKSKITSINRIKKYLNHLKNNLLLKVLIQNYDNILSNLFNGRLCEKCTINPYIGSNIKLSEV